MKTLQWDASPRVFQLHYYPYKYEHEHEHDETYEECIWIESKEGKISKQTNILTYEKYVIKVIIIITTIIKILLKMNNLSGI